jgi:lysophospholipase L1-like esterase
VADEKRWLARGSFLIPRFAANSPVPSRRTIGAWLTIALCATVLSPSAADALSNQPRFSLPIASGPPGTVLLAKPVQNCPPTPHGQTQRVTFSFTDAAGSTTYQGSTDVKKNGSWRSGHIIVPYHELLSLDPVTYGADAAQGKGEVRGWCYLDNAGQTVTQTYVPQSFTVTGKSLQFKLSAATGPLAGRVEIVPSSACPRGSTMAAGGMDNYHKRGVSYALRLNLKTEHWHRTWIRIPDGLPAGRYAVHLGCYDPSGFYTEYADVLFTITGPGRYVALGDSYSSGEANPPFVKAEGECDLSKAHAWPELLAAEHPAHLALARDLACSGAYTSALTSEYLGQQPQLKAMAGLHPNLVTITIGGNNIGFANVLADCWLGSNCAADGTIRTASRKIARLGKSIENVYAEIRKSVPRSTSVLVVGYPQLFPSGRGRTGLRCPWLAKDEQTGLNQLARQLNSVLTAAARTAGLSYVSTLNALSGHELCSAHPWVRALELNNVEYSGHPLLKGQLAIAAIVGRAIGSAAN